MVIKYLVKAQMTVSMYLYPHLEATKGPTSHSVLSAWVHMPHTMIRFTKITNRKSYTFTTVAF